MRVEPELWEVDSTVLECVFFNFHDNKVLKGEELISSHHSSCLTIFQQFHSLYCSCISVINLFSFSSAVRLLQER